MQHNDAIDLQIASQLHDRAACRSFEHKKHRDDIDGSSINRLMY